MVILRNLLHSMANDKSLSLAIVTRSPSEQQLLEIIFLLKQESSFQCSGLLHSFAFASFSHSTTCTHHNHTFQLVIESSSKHPTKPEQLCTIMTFILVLDCNFILLWKLSLEHSQHHKHKFIIIEICIVDGHASYVISQSCLYDQFPCDVAMKDRVVLWCHCWNSVENVGEEFKNDLSNVPQLKFWYIFKHSGNNRLFALQYDLYWNGKLHQNCLQINSEKKRFKVSTVQI